MNTSPDLLKRVEDALNTLRPYLEADNGNVSLIDITSDMVVRLRFHGACSSCSMSAMTLKAGIEQAILRSVPEIREVRAIQEDEESIA
ncbi:MAG: NifU family protein [Bacteroidetes bacterium]|jgi:Fe-S cluster biogenesis protein NfuA|nr:NifU family protein [Bacteroidota bacterium]MBP6402730.1 NifU family protein [Bacteroidia bacterium]MBK6838265.1 NifU family protein [Bacteroidota bacterium]MBK9543981.1 NifU family protein [Bacteroidota bacterium]MBL0256550.1 NifU family protein [Bacteroidota bacterium]